MWSTKEKFAILKSICYLVGADGRITNQEMSLISEFIRRYGLNSSAMNEQANMSQQEMERIIRSLSKTDKELIKGFWKEAIICDGDVATREVEVFVMMADNCGVDISEII